MSTSDTFTFLPKNTTDIFTLLSADAFEKIGLFSMENTRKAIERLKEQKKNELTQLTAPSMANDDTVQVYRVEDIQNILQISRTAAYALVKEEPPFHVVRFGKSKNSVIRISKEDFDSWLNNPVQKNGGI